MNMDTCRIYGGVNMNMDTCRIYGGVNMNMDTSLNIWWSEHEHGYM